jgi:hypothetical protein
MSETDKYTLMSPVEIKDKRKQIREYCIKLGFEVYPIMGEVKKQERFKDLGNQDDILVLTGALWQVSIDLGARYKPDT